jgi:adenylosuccinate synthase
MREAWIVVDLGYGDSGKGTVTDFLVRDKKAGLVVRYNGGPQAGHAVVEGDRDHVFSQFGSGTFVPGVETYLSRHMLVNPYNLYNEYNHLTKIGYADAIDRLYIDHQCSVITPFHQAANMLRELARGAAAHGTCGMGVGEAQQDLLKDKPGCTLTVGEAVKFSYSDLSDRLWLMQLYKYEELLEDGTFDQIAHLPEAGPYWNILKDTDWLRKATSRCSLFKDVLYKQVVSDLWLQERLEQTNVVFEGAQGVLLDEDWGFHPHTTWSHTTSKNAETLLRSYTGNVHRLGVMRAYMTRHGAGPLVTEDAELKKLLPETFSADDSTQGVFRVGWPDFVAWEYAVRVQQQVGGPLDGLALTHLDRWEALEQRKGCIRYFNGFPIHYIPSTRPDDFAGREKKTEKLKEALPRYGTLGSERLIPNLENHLQLPVLLESRGPEWKHKTWRSSSMAETLSASV